MIGWRSTARAGAHNPDYLRQIWDDERGKLFAALKANGQLGLLDDHVGKDGLDFNMTAPLPKKNP